MNMTEHIPVQEAPPGQPPAPPLQPAWWLKVLVILLAAMIAGVLAGTLGPKNQPAENLREVQAQMIYGALLGVGIITLLGVVILVQRRGHEWRGTLVLWLLALPYWVGFGAVFSPIFNGIKPGVVGLPGNWGVRWAAVVLGPVAFGLMSFVVALSSELLRVFGVKRFPQQPRQEQETGPITG
jgi:hypothetical protein